MLHQVLLPQNLPEIQDAAKQQKLKSPAWNHFGSLEQTCGEREKKGNQMKEQTHVIYKGKEIPCNRFEFTVPTEMLFIQSVLSSSSSSTFPLEM